MTAAAYADINNDRGYPAITRVESYKHALRILRHFGNPKDAAVRAVPVGAVWDPDLDDFVTGTREATRSELMRIFRRYLSGTRQHGRSKELGRTCWASSKPSCGHNKGWGRLIHDVSHMVHEYRHPKERPHGHLHSGIEREVQVYVELSGMLETAPKPVRPSTDERRRLRLAQLTARRVRWASKQRRAELAVKKLQRQIRSIERALPMRQRSLKDNALDPDVRILANLASLVVHLEEAKSAAGHWSDVAAIETILADPGVQQWVDGMRKLGLTPVKR